MSDALIGRIVDGRYRIDALLGEGRSSCVYVAEQLSMSRAVALKVLQPELVNEEVYVVRFRREVEAVTRLRSPHCITFFDFGRLDEGLYIAMELLEGESLRARLEREMALDPVTVLAIVRQIGACLAEAHGAGILHRDLKPENVFLCQSAGTEAEPFVKVLDFGLAKLLGMQAMGAPNVTAPRTTVGTPAYLAPEMARIAGTPDARVDLYALGVMIFEMLVGVRPFRARNVAQMIQEQAFAAPPAPSSLHPGLPAAVDAFMHVALAKEPAGRFASAEALVAALEDALGAH